MTGPRFSALARALRRLTRSVVPYLTTAALLVFTAAVTFAAMGHPYPTREGEATHLPALIRALHATPGEVDDDLLIEAIFAPDERPAGDAEPIFYRVTLPPGTSLPALAGPFSTRRGDFVASGVGIEVVQSGAYSLRLETPLRVQRAGASGVTEEIAAQRDVLLGPGDAAIYADYTGPGTIRNAGHTPVVVIGMAVASLEGTSIDLPQLPEDIDVELLASSITSGDEDPAVLLALSIEPEAIWSTTLAP